MGLGLLVITYEDSDEHFSVFQILEQQKVAEQFLLVNTALIQALDELPNSLEISEEVREQVNFNDFSFRSRLALHFWLLFRTLNKCPCLLEVGMF